MAVAVAVAVAMIHEQRMADDGGRTDGVGRDVTGGAGGRGWGRRRGKEEG